jgi:hypothetical protein
MIPRLSITRPTCTYLLAGTGDRRSNRAEVFKSSSSLIHSGAVSFALDLSGPRFLLE